MCNLRLSDGSIVSGVLLGQRADGSVVLSEGSKEARDNNGQIFAIKVADIPPKYAKLVTLVVERVH